MENKKFCIKPFNSIHVGTTGRISACCVSRTKHSDFKGNLYFNVKEHTIQDFWTSDYIKNLRSQFLKGERPKECQTCWREESQNITSLRQFTNRQYQILGNKDPQKYLKILKKENLLHPEDYNLDISNLCNLKCYMCHGGSSSKLLVENNVLGIEKLNQSDYEYTDDKIEHLIQQIIEHKVKYITLQGGEPLLNPNIIKILHKLSEKDYANKISVWITTNGTIYNDRIPQILQQFGNVKLIFSVDGVGKVNDYLRFPSKFSEIESNIKKYKNLDNATFMITCTVQNFNLLNVREMIDFAHDMSIHLYLNYLHWPSYLHLSVLPKKIKERALEKIRNTEKEKLIHVTNFDSLLDVITNQINVTDVSKMQTFKNMIVTRDRYRKIDIKDFIPEISQVLNI